MYIPSLFVSFTSSLALLLLWLSPAAAFQAKVIPSTISQGDVFMVRVTGARTEDVSVIFRKASLPIAPCGEGCYFAVGAADIQTKPGKYGIKIVNDRRKRGLKLTVKRTVFPKMHISLPEEKVSPGEEDLARIKEEAERFKSATEKITPGTCDSSFVMPLDTAVSTAYGTKRIFNHTRESIHRGLDLRGAEGNPVKACNAGTVVMMDELFFGGKTLVIDHGMGIFSIYMHLSGFASAPGDKVNKGDVIGYVGSTGRSSGPHLHFGVKVQGISANPASLLKLGL